MMSPFYLGLCFFSCLSYQYSFFMFIIYTTPAAGRVLFALIEKSTWVLIARISFLFLPINTTNHALILLLCHPGEVHFCFRTSLFGFISVPVSICRDDHDINSLKWNILSSEIFQSWDDPHFIKFASHSFILLQQGRLDFCRVLL